MIHKRRRINRDDSLRNTFEKVFLKLHTEEKLLQIENIFVKVSIT
jgi:hypothetical protein